MPHLDQMISLSFLHFRFPSCLPQRVVWNKRWHFLPLFMQILVLLYIKCSFCVFELLVVMNQKQICNISVMPEQFLQQKLQRTCLKYTYIVKVSKSVLYLP